MPGGMGRGAVTVTGTRGPRCHPPLAVTMQPPCSQPRLGTVAFVLCLLHMLLSSSPSSGDALGAPTPVAGGSA